MRALGQPRRLVLLAIYLGLLGLGLLLGRWFLDLIVLDIRPSTEAQVHAMIMATLAAYVLASMIPFVPGAEIGLGLMLVGGAGLAWLVYASMVAALTMAYLIGRLVPARAIAAAFAYFGFARAAALVREVEPLDGRARLALLTARAPARVIPLLLRHRYLALAVAFNLPGNTLVGGGGGIALVAGMSGLYPLAAYLLTVALAVAPVPLLFFLGARLW